MAAGTQTAESIDNWDHDWNYVFFEDFTGVQLDLNNWK